MDIISIYQQVGSYRGTAAICGTTPKTVKRVIARAEAGGTVSPRKARVRNYASVADLVAARVASSSGRISAKRLLPAARVAGFTGSARNFRRLVAGAKVEWRREDHRGRRPAVWAPGEYLVIDWGNLGGVKVFCAVLAWSRVRFVRFAADEQATTTMAMLAECFEAIGGVPAKVLADRMGCLKGGVVANVVVPTPDYVSFTAHYGFVPDFCNAADPASKGIVENLVGYGKSDLLVPLLDDLPDVASPAGLAAANLAAIAWCTEVNAAVHSQIAAVPAERLVAEGPLLGALPSLRASIGPAPVVRKVDKLSCVRFSPLGRTRNLGGAQSVPNHISLSYDSRFRFKAATFVGISFRASRRPTSGTRILPMYRCPMEPVDTIEACRTSHRLLLAGLAPLTDDDFRAPSLLPRYSRGHVVTHIANKSKAHVLVFGGPAAGEIRKLHPDGYDPDLAADLGASRSAAELRSDLAQCFSLLEATWDAFDDILWDRQGIMAAGARTMAEIVAHHLRNVEVHHVDLDIGHRPSDWPPILVEGELSKRLRSFPDRADHAEILAWLLGRAPAPELTGPW